MMSLDDAAAAAGGVIFTTIIFRDARARHNTMADIILSISSPSSSRRGHVRTTVRVASFRSERSRVRLKIGSRRRGANVQVGKLLRIRSQNGE